METDPLIAETRATSIEVDTSEEARLATRRERIARLVQRGGAAVVLVIVVVLASLVFGARFANVDNLLNILEASSFLGLIAVGMTFVIIGGGIDLSVGSLLALSAVLAAYGSQYGSLVAVALPLGVCGLIGLTNGVLISRARMAPFIVTLAALLFARGLAFAVSDEGNNDLSHPGRARRPGPGPGLDRRHPDPDHHRRGRVPGSGGSCSSGPVTGRP